MKYIKILLFKLGIIDCIHEWSNWYESGSITDQKHCKKCNRRKTRLT